MARWGLFVSSWPRLLPSRGSVLSSGFQDVVPGWADERAHLRVDHDGGGRLLDDGGPRDRRAGREREAAEHRGLAPGIAAEIGLPRRRRLGLVASGAPGRGLRRAREADRDLAAPVHALDL